MIVPARQSHSEAPIYRFVTCADQPNDPRSAGLLLDARALGIRAVERLQCNDLYFVQGWLTADELKRIADELLRDPLTQRIDWQGLGVHTANEPEAVDALRVEVVLRTGVTDPVAEQIVRAARELGIAGVERAATGQQFLLGGDLRETDLHTLVQRLLANPVIQRYALGEVKPAFPQGDPAPGKVDVLPVRDLDDAGLLACSDARLAALDLAELRAIQRYFRSEGRDPTDVEFEMLAQTWSEHCVHKTFRALIDVEAPEPSPYPPQVDNVLNTYIRRATDEIAAPWVLSAFVDNAGIV